MAISGVKARQATDIKMKTIKLIKMRLIVAIIPLTRWIYLPTGNLLIPLNSFLRVYYSLSIFFILEVAQCSIGVIWKKLVLSGACALYTLGTGSIGWCLVPVRYVGAHVLGVAEFLS